MEYEETVEEVETLQTDIVFKDVETFQTDIDIENVETSAIEIYSEVTSEPLTLETIYTGSDSETDIETSSTTYNDSENLQRIADNTDFGVGFLQAFVVAFVMIMLYRFLKIFF